MGFFEENITLQIFQENKVEKRLYYLLLLLLLKFVRVFDQIVNQNLNNFTLQLIKTRALNNSISPSQKNKVFDYARLPY